AAAAGALPVHAGGVLLVPGDIGRGRPVVVRCGGLVSPTRQRGSANQPAATTNRARRTTHERDPPFRVPGQSAVAPVRFGGVGGRPGGGADARPTGGVGEGGPARTPSRRRTVQGWPLRRGAAPVGAGLDPAPAAASAGRVSRRPPRPG